MFGLDVMISFNGKVVGMHDTIAAKIITVLTRYRPVVLELI